MALSATSAPSGTVILRIKSDAGTQIDWFATKIVSYLSTLGRTKDDVLHGGWTAVGVDP